MDVPLKTIFFLLTEKKKLAIVCFLCSSKMTKIRDFYVVELSRKLILTLTLTFNRSFSVLVYPLLFFSPFLLFLSKAQKGSFLSRLPNFHTSFTLRSLWNDFEKFSFPPGENLKDDKRPQIVFHSLSTVSLSNDLSSSLLVYFIGDDSLFSNCSSWINTWMHHFDESLVSN